MRITSVLKIEDKFMTLTIVKHCFHLLDMWSGSRSAIDPLRIKAKQVDCLHTLVDDHRDRRAVSAEKLVKRHSEDGSEGR